LKKVGDLQNGIAMAPAFNVMVVDDDPDIREVLSDCLAMEGYAVVEAANGAEALSCLRRGVRPDLIVLDLMMPVMDGWRFGQELKHDPALSALPVLLTSAVNDLERAAASIGARGCLPKPFALSSFLDAVERHCRPAAAAEGAGVAAC
jgi:CheY-like chemotaxis protein